MNIDWIIPCRYIEVHDNLGTLVGAGIDTFWTQTIPTQVGVAMAIRLTALAEELNPDVPHTVRNIIKGPSGEIISEVGGEVRFGADGPPPEHVDGWLQGLMMHTVVQFEVEAPGTYTFEHQVDTASYSVPVHIVHGAPPGV